MTRTQVQLPDELYRRVKLLAAEKEISLAEVVRHGLAYILSVNPPGRSRKGRWSLDAPVLTPLVADPFASPDWRDDANAGSSMAGIASSRPRTQARRRHAR